MSDKPQGGYEYDLREVESAMAAAGHPDIALGMRRHSEAQRNMMQGVLVPMFVQMVERALDAKLLPLTDQIGGLRGDTGALQAEFQSGLSGIQDTVSTLVETVDSLQTRMDESQEDRRALHEKVAALRTDFTAYAAGSRRAELSALHSRITALEDDKARFEAVELALKELSARV